LGKIPINAGVRADVANLRFVRSHWHIFCERAIEPRD
jgi:hypothetical protein